MAIEKGAEMSQSIWPVPWTYLTLQKRAQQLLGIDFNSQSSSSNAAMVHADIYGESESRYRNCMTIGCGKSFKFQHADDWVCPGCKTQRAELIRRDRVNEGLFNANGKVRI
jgi:hypothetical protein